MANIGIIGSGNVGANTAFFMAEKGVGDVLMYDISEGLSTGKALDMMEAAPVRGYKVKLSGTDSLEEALSSEIILVAGGSVRKPGMKREDLFDANREMITDLGQKLKGSSSKVIVVTEPVDLLTSVLVAESGLPREQVMGLGGMLDSTRLRYLVSEELGVTTENIMTTVIGRHSDDMIPLSRYCTVSGIPLEQLIPAQRLSELYEETRKAGGLIVDMAQRASSYYGPSAAACDLAEAISRDLRRVLSVSLMFRGEYGIDGVAMSLPAVIGKNGAEQVLVPELTMDEQKALEASAKELRATLGQ